MIKRNDLTEDALIAISQAQRAGPRYTLTIGAEDRDTLELALLQEAKVTIEGGSPPYVGDTLRLYIKSIAHMLMQLGGAPTPLMQHVMDGKHPADYAPFPNGERP